MSAVSHFDGIVNTAASGRFEADGSRNAAPGSAYMYCLASLWFFALSAWQVT
jgi:hypothetical protein